MLLDSTMSLTVVLGGAAATTEPQGVACWEDLPVSGQVGGIAPVHQPGSAAFITTGSTAITLVAAPAAGFVRRVTTIHLYNIDSAAITPNFKVVVGATGRTVFKGTRATLENLFYGFTTGWQGYSVALAKQ